MACSLHQLQAALAWAVRRKGGGNVVESGDKTVKSVWKEDGGRAWGNQEWLTFVARYQKYYVLQQQQQLAPPPPSPPSVPRGLLLPHHASQYGALLQVCRRGKWGGVRGREMGWGQGEGNGVGSGEGNGVGQGREWGGVRGRE